MPKLIRPNLQRKRAARLAAMGVSQTPSESKARDLSPGDAQPEPKKQRASKPKSNPSNS